MPSWKYDVSNKPNNNIVNNNVYFSSYTETARSTYLLKKINKYVLYIFFINHGYVLSFWKSYDKIEMLVDFYASICRNL